MNDAHEDVVKLPEECGVDFFLKAVAEAGRIRLDVVIDEFQGLLPCWFLIQCVSSLEVLETEVDVVCCASLAVAFLVMLGECFCAGKNLTGALGADMDVDCLAGLHVCQVDVVGMSFFDVGD